MTREEIIQGLQFTIDMFLLDPSTGETFKKPRNDMDKTTIDACKGAIELLEQQPCEVAVSQQAAIDALDTILWGVEWDKALATAMLKDLPPVQPKYNTDEWCHDCSEYNQDKHCCPRYNKVIRNTIEEMKQCEDTISRKEALEALKQEEPLVWCDGADEIAAYNQWSSDVDTIKNIPSVQPKPIECEDAISREQAIEQCGFGMTSLHIADNLRRLPPVTPKPKTGQWVLLDECSNSGYYCSECHKKLVKEGYSDTVKKIKYCPNCGCRMVEPQESEES